jgi:hypothetical protein
MLALSALTLALTACATQPHPHEAGLPGFLPGLIHGFLMPFSFVCSFFMDVRIYAYPNGGMWYDFGYLIGAALILGGGGASSRRR